MYSTSFRVSYFIARLVRTLLPNRVPDFQPESVHQHRALRNRITAQSAQHQRKTIQTILRHSNIGLTMNVYVKSVAESSVNAMEAPHAISIDAK